MAAVDAYPQYGAYQPTPPVPVPYASASYVLDILDTDRPDSQIGPASNVLGYPYIFRDTIALGNAMDTLAGLITENEWLDGKRSIW